MEGFGASAPAKVLYQHFGFTGEDVAQRARTVLARHGEAAGGEDAKPETGTRNA
jgi:hypothetical protein